MGQNAIVIKGAREHNLKDIDLSIPRDELVVITGLSGSGKSSLAFDTMYAVGQRLYVESLSSYARMFLGQMSKPDLDSIDGLSPAVSIDQKTTSKNPRSTVGTTTEIYDYLRLLFARVGVPHCPECGRVVIVGAVQRHHLGYGALFAVAAPSDLGAVLLGHVTPPGLDREDTRIQPNAHARFSLESGNADRPRTMPNRTVCAQNLNESDERMFLPIPRSDCAKMSDCTEMIVLR